ncbi:MAG: hypothetical protein R3Y64_10015 [Peptostreptococcaceae bacterium]
MKITSLVCLSLMTIGCSDEIINSSNLMKSNVEDNIRKIIEDDMSYKELDEVISEYNTMYAELELREYFETDDELEFALNSIGKRISNIELAFTSQGTSALTSIYEDKSSLISDYIGKQIILEINQDSCSYCISSAPIVHDAIKDTDVLILPIFVNSTTEGVMDFYDMIGVDIDEVDNIFLDEKKDFVSSLEITSTPAYLYIDESGRISFVKTGDYNSISEVLFDINKAFNSEKIYDNKTV